MSDNQTRHYYTARALEYEQIYYRDQPERRREIDDEVTQLQTLVKDQTVLDIACGSGYWTQHMSKTAASIVATDASLEMLEVARTKDYACPVELVQADMYQMPFEANAFDMVTVGFWLSHEPKQDLSAFFKLLLHPLKKGGRLWLIDNNPPAEGPTNESHHVDEYGNNFKRRFLDDDTEYVILKNYFTPDNLRSLVPSDFSIERITYGRCYWIMVLRS